MMHSGRSGSGVMSVTASAAGGISSPMATVAVHTSALAPLPQPCSPWIEHRGRRRWQRWWQRPLASMRATYWFVDPYWVRRRSSPASGSDRTRPTEMSLGPALDRLPVELPYRQAAAWWVVSRPVGCSSTSLRLSWCRTSRCIGSIAHLLACRPVVIRGAPQCERVTNCRAGIRSTR
jgi:hypothetical protein